MFLYLKEIEDPNTEEVSYELQDEEGKTVVNLTDSMYGNLSEVEDFDDYYAGNTSGEDDYDCQVLFNLKGEIIISRIHSHKYVDSRDEFIVYVNGANSDDCYNETCKYDEEFYGVINKYGDFILPPKYNKIVYDEEFDLYLVNDEDYYINGEYIGSVADQDVDNYLVFRKNKTLGILNKEGIILEPDFSTINQPGENGFVVISDGERYGIHNLESENRPFLKFDEISDAFYHDFLDEGYYLVRIGKQFGLANNEMELLFNNLLDGIDEDSFTNHSYENKEGKTVFFTTFIAWENGKFWHGKINEDVFTTRECILTGASNVQNGFDYLKLFFIENPFQSITEKFITVGFENLKNGRNYNLLVYNKNQIFCQEEYKIYPLGLNNELLITQIEKNQFGALVINNSRQIKHSRHTIAIPFKYEKLKVIFSRNSYVIGIIGHCESYYEAIEPMNFRQIGQANSHEEAIEILKEYYTNCN